MIVDPNKTVKTHGNFQDESKSLILNIVRKKWVAVANIIFKHQEIRIGPLRKTIRDEFTLYMYHSRDDTISNPEPAILCWVTL